MTRGAGTADETEKRPQTPIALSPEGHIFYNKLSNFCQLEE